MSIVKLPQQAWYEPRERGFALPDRWQVEICNMAGADKPAMKPEAIRAAMNNPIGTKTLKELARGKKEVVIIFDDMSRVSRVILPAHRVHNVSYYADYRVFEEGVEHRRIRVWHRHHI